ncbi:unnamed protein product [Brassicogethes aeneus]|uniref:Uncharacterized protein n=1 Tax=Brassicogethes aeneus TaxID=1431903 RepID=A0A9P0BIC7_BRAAE|nr:unnamed protein product [Brassicogethes aeneus]
MKQPKMTRLLTERHLERIGEMLQTLLEEEELTDVTLHCRDGTIKAHKLMLAASSPYFRRILVEHNKENVALIMHGISREKLRKIIEVIYYGSAEIQGESADAMCDLIDEFDLNGVMVTESTEKEEKMNGHGRDTRFKGQKRVAVDFTHSDNEGAPAKISKNDRISTDKKSPEKKSPGKSSPDKSCAEMRKQDSDSASGSSGCADINEFCVIKKEEIVTFNDDEMLNIPTESKLTSWDKKPRKFVCTLCPSSFKRASHLTRHQLVHTGERPYACEHCDKAFSRHDKLKNHVRKNHDLEGDFISKEDVISGDTQYSIGTVRMPSPPIKQNRSEESYDDNHTLYASNFSHLVPILPKLNPEVTILKAQSMLKEAINKSFKQVASSSPNVSNLSNASDVSNVSNTSSNTSFGANGTPKKGRGRPRKYPPPPPQLVKRPRGRPRLNPLSASPQIPGRIGPNYDITNLPFGDLEYLTKPLREMEQSMEDPIIEPYVEIKTDETDAEEKKEETPKFLEPEVSLQENPKEKEEEKTLDDSLSFLTGIGLCEKKHGTIGECTISVSN